MNNPEVTKFLNEVVRPRAELLRAVKALLNADAVRWSSVTQSLIPNDATAIDDGRTAEGVTELKGSDVHDIMFAFGVVSNAINGLASQTIEKPCVRPLQAN